jgi:uncharacterized protein
MKAVDRIQALDLRPHPEGGWFRETYRSPLRLPAHALPKTYGGERAAMTAIHFLLESGQISALHRLRSDEMWFFHEGAPLRISIIRPSGSREDILLGANVAAGERLQASLPADGWFGAMPAAAAPDYSLVSCVVAPGFEFEDFVLGDRPRLLAEFPQHRAAIERLTRLRT